MCLFAPGKARICTRGQKGGIYRLRADRAPTGTETAKTGRSQDFRPDGCKGPSRAYMAPDKTTAPDRAKGHARRTRQRSRPDPLTKAAPGARWTPGKIHRRDRVQRSQDRRRQDRPRTTKQSKKVIIISCTFARI